MFNVSIDVSRFVSITSYVIVLAITDMAIYVYRKYIDK